jgi:hypothetical protein
MYPFSRSHRLLPYANFTGGISKAATLEHISNQDRPRVSERCGGEKMFIARTEDDSRRCIDAAEWKTKL